MKLNRQTLKSIRYFTDSHANYKALEKCDGTLVTFILKEQRVLNTLDLVKLFCGKAINLIKETITIVSATSDKSMHNFYAGFMGQIFTDAIDIVGVKICCTTKFSFLKECTEKTSADPKV